MKYNLFDRRCNKMCCLFPVVRTCPHLILFCNNVIIFSIQVKCDRFGFFWMQNDTGSNRAEKLWDSLLRCKDELFPSFQRALTDAHQQHIVDRYLAPSDYKKSTKLQISPREHLLFIMAIALWKNICQIEKFHWKCLLQCT